MIGLMYSFFEVLFTQHVKCYFMNIFRMFFYVCLKKNVRTPLIGKFVFFRALGYKNDSDGNPEKQDQFLKRMSGIMRLYASVMVAHPPRGPNPFGTEHAWAWLSMVMNIEPLPDITATMTFDLLQVTGHALYRDYRKQFFKLLHILIKEFLPKLKQVASPSGGGPMIRLEDFLQTSVKNNGNIPPPEGLLNAHFWMS